MHDLTVGCQKHPDKIFTVTTGTNRHDYIRLDEKGLYELYWKDSNAQDRFIQDLIQHFTKCDGQMIVIAEQHAD